MTLAPDLSPTAPLVLGAGVAGLAVSAAMAQRGAAVTLLEQSAEISEVGAGLQLSPNGTRVLRALGIDPYDIGPATRAVELRDHRGALVTRLDLSQTPGFHLAHRADLIAALETTARAAGVAVHLLQQVKTLSRDDQSVTLTTAQGAQHHGALVLGADGLHSVVRSQLNGAAAPFFTGQVAWRALIPGDGGPDVAQVFMGPGRHLVSYPLRNGSLRNIVAILEQDQWVAEGWNHPDSPETLRAVFSAFGGPVPEWLAALDQVWLWGLFRHPVAEHWHDGQGCMAILGDAAHPTLPFMAQGANLALEDAWVLAQCLSKQPETPAQALAQYQARRQGRARAVIEAANKNARAYHLRAPIAPLAHAALRLAGRIKPDVALRRFDWIYRTDVTA